MPFILFRILSRRYALFRKRVRVFVDNTLEHTFRGSMIYLIMITLIWIAIFLYLVFYYAYVPALSYSRPVHLQIPSEEDTGRNTGFPNAYIRLTKRNQLLMMGQAYKFTVKLEMPESPVNKQLGMFMVCLQLKGKHGYLASQSCRSGILQYNSNLVRIAKLVVFSPLFIFGAKQEKQTLYFELYNDFEEDQRHPVTDVYVEVRAHNIEIYSATLQISAVLSGLRYFMFYWPATSALIGITLNLFIVFFTTSLSFYNNFFIDTAPVQMLKSHFKKLEEESTKFLEGTFAETPQKKVKSESLQEETVSLISSVEEKESSSSSGSESSPSSSLKSERKEGLSTEEGGEFANLSIEGEVLEDVPGVDDYTEEGDTVDRIRS